jgi:hypothetical protein
MTADEIRLFHKQIDLHKEIRDNDLIDTEREINECDAPNLFYPFSCLLHALCAPRLRLARQRRTSSRRKRSPLSVDAPAQTAVPQSPTKAAISRRRQSVLA